MHPFGVFLLIICAVSVIQACGPLQTVEGPPGPPGRNGRDGRRGERGPRGAEGPEGEKGQTGDRGIQGVPGQQGEVGDPGEDGDKGIQVVQSNTSKLRDNPEAVEKKFPKAWIVPESIEGRNYSYTPSYHRDTTNHLAKKSDRVISVTKFNEIKG